MKNVTSNEKVKTRARMNAERITGTKEYSYDGTIIGEICPQKSPINAEKLFAIERHQDGFIHLRAHSDKEYAKRLGKDAKRITMLRIWRMVAAIGADLNNYQFQPKTI